MTRRLLGTIAAIAATLLFVGHRGLDAAAGDAQLALPLSDTGIIRRQAAEKRLDPL